MVLYRTSKQKICELGLGRPSASRSRVDTVDTRKIQFLKPYFVPGAVRLSAWRGPDPASVQKSESVWKRPVLYALPYT